MPPDPDDYLLAAAIDVEIDSELPCGFNPYKLDFTVKLHQFMHLVG